MLLVLVFVPLMAACEPSAASKAEAEIDAEKSKTRAAQAQGDASDGSPKSASKPVGTLTPEEKLRDSAPDSTSESGDNVDSPNDLGLDSEPEARGTDLTLGTHAEILRFALAHDIDKRLPVDEADSFPSGQRVNLFIEARNQSGTDLHISVSWENTATGRRSPATEVRIGKGKVYRTRAYRTMPKAGSYRAIVVGPEGQELAVLPFTIRPER